MSRDLLFLGLSLFTWGIGEGAFFYFQPLYLAELGASPVIIGGILGGVGITMSIMHIPAGYLADRIGRRKMMWTAWILGLSSAWLMALADNLLVFTAGILLYGITAFVVAPMNSYVTAARGRWPVERAITLTSAAYNGGAIVGPIIGGLIGGRFGLRQIYLFSGVVFLISTLFIFLIQAQPIEPHERGSSRDLLRNQGFRWYLPLILLAVFAMYLPQPLSSNFLQNERGLTVQMIGFLGSVSSLGNVILTLSLGLGNAVTGFLLGQFGVVLFSLFLWLGHNLPWFVAAYFFFGGYRAARALAIARVGGMIASTQMGLAYGIAETVSGLGVILAPLLAGILYQWRPEAPFQVAILLVLLSISIGVYSLRMKKAIPTIQIGGK